MIYIAYAIIAGLVLAASFLGLVAYASARRIKASDDADSLYEMDHAYPLDTHRS